MIVTWSKGIADYNMSEDILTELAEAMNRHPWWRARARLALAILAAERILPPARILDAGCGSGILLDALEARGYQVCGLDISRRSLEQLDRPGRQLIEADLTRCEPPEGESFDAILLLDVLEHLDDEKVVLRTLRRLLKPGGLAVVSVPARPDLFSEFDEIQGHRRRYLPDSLQSAFEGTGLKMKRMMWWGSWMVPSLTLQRKRRKAVPGEPVDVTYLRYLRTPPWPLSGLVKLAFAWDHGRTLGERNHTGTSLLAVAGPERTEV
jgi:SAM-dependent methyltransferase